MPSQNSPRFGGRSTSPRQPVRLLTAYEKPQRCEWPDCGKPATGANERRVYCPTHFFAAVSKHW
ncbi:MAG: hypothetical protein FJ147_14895 [Deltaproteobacteria bacterium]|nr:hypothetical protein [Deltaproteobacteria bacterium]